MLTYTDVTDLVRRAQQFEHLATTDGLTGLCNRRQFDVLAEVEWKRFQRYYRALSMIVIDIDHFKDINDRSGHEAGDNALRTLAAVCMEGKRSTDVVARLGGDEFVMLLPETNCRQARNVAERILNAVHSALDGVTVSVGTAEATTSMSGIEALLRSADRALYHAKSAGKNCIRDGARIEIPEHSTAAR